MKMPYIEQQFEYHDLPCVVIMTSMGHRCGYVGVSKEHPLHGVGMSDKVFPRSMVEGMGVGTRGIMPVLFAAFDGDDSMISLDLYFDVHGSITYSEHDTSYRFGKPGVWWFGFDCGHHGDAREIDHPAVDESTRRVERDFPSRGIVRTLEYCVAECKKLADQLHELQCMGWTIAKEGN